MNKYFHATPNTDEWIICWTGYDEETLDGWNVTTNHIHGSELHRFTRGAKGDAELIASLLNWYYNNDVAKTVIDSVEKESGA